MKKREKKKDKTTKGLNLIAMILCIAVILLSGFITLLSTFIINADGRASYTEDYLKYVNYVPTADEDEMYNYFNSSIIKKEDDTTYNMYKGIILKKDEEGIFRYAPTDTIARFEYVDELLATSPNDNLLKTVEIEKRGPKSLILKYQNDRVISLVKKNTVSLTIGRIGCISGIVGMLYGLVRLINEMAMSNKDKKFEIKREALKNFQDMNENNN